LNEEIEKDEYEVVERKESNLITDIMYSLLDLSWHLILPLFDFL